MICPNCGFEQIDTGTCTQCQIVISKFFETYQQTQESRVNAIKVQREAVKVRLSKKKLAGPKQYKAQLAQLALPRRIATHTPQQAELLLEAITTAQPRLPEILQELIRDMALLQKTKRTKEQIAPILVEYEQVKSKITDALSFYGKANHVISTYLKEIAKAQKAEQKAQKKGKTCLRKNQTSLAEDIAAPIFFCQNCGYFLPSDGVTCENCK